MQLLSHSGRCLADRSLVLFLCIFGYSPLIITDMGRCSLNASPDIAESLRLLDHCTCPSLCILKVSIFTPAFSSAFRGSCLKYFTLMPLFDTSCVCAAKSSSI